jgi:starch-binding outer membrane protein, SusD/RagB family
MWPTPDIKNAYRNNDLRKTANLDSVRITGTFQTYCKKYLHSAYGTVPFNSFDSDINFPVLRFADVLLMYAEAINEANGGPNAVAYDALNRVRRRAFGVTNTSADYPANLSKNDFFLAVETERRLELAFEGHRWFDLLRTDRAIPVMTAKGSPIKAHHVLFPIPQAEIDINPGKMKQNPGY